MKLKRVFITREIPNVGIKKLQSEGFQVEINFGDGPISKELLYQKAQDADAIITMLTDQIDADFLQKNSHLKVISNFAVGLNNIDQLKAQELNIKIGNTPDVLTNATAEIAMGLILTVARDFKNAHEDLMNGKFKSFDPLGFLGTSLKGKTLGIVGLGRIGSEVAEMASKAFLMKIIYTSESSTATNLSYQKVSLDELLTRSDFVSIHCPLTDKTKHLIAKREFNLMKKEAIIINTSRGEVINQDDLITALINHRIKAAGLDVTTPEPLPNDHPLLKLKNCYLLPHIGSATIETRDAMSLMCAENIINAF